MTGFTWVEEEKIEIQRELISNIESLCEKYCRKNVADVVDELEKNDVFYEGEIL